MKSKFSNKTCRIIIHYLVQLGIIVHPFLVHLYSIVTCELELVPGVGSCVFVLNLEASNGCF